MLEHERHRLLVRIDDALAAPMMVLSVLWVALVVTELWIGLSPFFETLGYVIWGLFVLQFLIELVIAPRKGTYLRRQWLTALSLLAPAFRLLAVFRLARAFTVVRGARLLRLVSGANRGMRVLARVMGRRGFGYVALLTLFITLAGAAGTYAFERGVPDTRFDSFGAALWWTAMTLTTMGADYFPVTPEGRVLSLLLAIYGFAVFGYVTATVASYFVARDADTGEAEIAGARQLEQVRRDLASLERKLDAVLAARGRGMAP